MIVIDIKGAVWEISTDKIIFEQINGIQYALMEYDKGIHEFPASEIISIENKPEDYILQLKISE